MVDIKQIAALMKNNRVFQSLLGSLVASIVLAIAVAIKKVVTFKMIYEVLINFNLLYVLEAIFIILTIIFSILFAKQCWDNLKSKLKVKEKEYEELKAKTRPRLPVHELFTCEVKREPIGKVRELVVRGVIYHLIFDMRVRNYTNYIFTPKTVYIACSCDSKLVFEAKWGWEQKPPTWYIDISDSLQSLRDGDIQFRVPIEKTNKNMRELKLKGYVEYTTDEDIIHDIPPKKVKVDINLDYELDEKIVKEIEQMLEKENA